MDPEKHRAISSIAGKASQATGTANKFRKGGNASAAGRRGGIASGLVRAQKKAAPRGHDQPETPPPGTGALSASGTIARDSGPGDAA